MEYVPCIINILPLHSGEIGVIYVSHEYNLYALKKFMEYYFQYNLYMNVPHITHIASLRSAALRGIGVIYVSHIII